MNYTLHQLRVYVEVVRQQSITRAAEEMHMTQPALSIQLKNFQKQFDYPLVEIIRKKLYVTELGREIAQMAEDVLVEAEAIQYKTKAYSGMLTGRLRISSVSTGKYVIPYFISEFIHRYEGVDLTLDVSNKASVLEQLAENKIDFALVSVIPEGLNVDEEILMDNHLHLTGNTPKKNKKMPLIYREQGSATGKAMEDYYGSVKDRKRLNLTSNEAVKQAVVAGLGHSILPLIGIRNELKNKELHIIPSKNLPIVTKWRLIWLKDKRLSPVAEAYLQYIREHKQETIEAHFAWIQDYLD